MKLLMLLGLLVGATAVHAGQAAPPKTMLKVVIQATAHDIPKGSFGEKPKTFYRAGNDYARSEEVYDPLTRLHQMVIVHGPEAWLIDLTVHQGKHMADHGPFHALHLPVFPVKDIPPVFYSFEIGREFESLGKMKKRKAPKSLDGKKCDSYVVESGGYRMVLDTDPGRERPLAAYLYKGEYLILTQKYLEYRTDLPFDSSLFKVPPGIEITEAK